MRILLTGKTGQVGWRLAHALPAVGDTIAVGREALDLTRPASIRETVRAVRPDVIVNAAGYTHVDDSEGVPEVVQAVNADGPGVLAAEAKRLGALLVHYSSVYVFDGTAAHPYTERDPTHPINEYGRSQLAGEHAIIAAGCAHLILRASWVYDTRGHNFVLTMLRLAAEREELRVVDDQAGSPTWAQSIAEATAGLVRDPDRTRAAPGVYNLAALGSVTRYDFVARLLALTAHLRPGREAPRLTRIKTPEFPLIAPRPLNSMLDCGLLRRTFDPPLTAWDAQLRACLSQLRASARG
jgi:dTDP-4-dehydrorhamnose reductase